MFYSKEKHQSKVLNRRKLVILISKFSFISIIGWKLFDIQISKSKKYKMMSKKKLDQASKKKFDMTSGFTCLGISITRIYQKCVTNPMGWVPGP